MLHSDAETDAFNLSLSR